MSKRGEMEELYSSDSDPSLAISSSRLQDTSVNVCGRSTFSPDLRDPSETSPLLLQFKHKQSSGTPPPNPAKLEAGGRRRLGCNWKNLITTLYLWLTYLIVSAAYSIIGPFFPSEVYANMISLSPTYINEL